ncbi:MAG: sugar ABC transporter permease [Trueperaceae bacterium]|nr:sugar ABC transporter permease [Trueperaceae bacterium]
MSRLARREMYSAWLFISPWVLGFLFFLALPIGLSVYYSFTAFNVFQPPRWIGLANFRVLSTDPLFWKALYNTAYYTFISVPLMMIISLGVALLLNSKLPGMRFFRTIFFLPAVLSGVGVALLWLWIFNPDYGLINLLLGYLGIEGPLWLYAPEWAKPAMIIMSLWGLGGVMVINLAGLQSVPQELFEAARVDGANGWAQFRYVTLPMLSPTLFFNFITLTIGSFQVFTQAYIMTGGGPVHSTLFYVLYLFQTAFESLRMGYASAMAWILFFVIVGVSLFQLAASRRLVYYEEG